MFRIVNKRELNSMVTLLEIEAPFVAKKAQAGQFIMKMVREYHLLSQIMTEKKAPLPLSSRR